MSLSDIMQIVGLVPNLHGVKVSNKARPSKSPAYPGIEEEGPPLSAALCRFSREDERYWQGDLPRDHDDDGVLHGGPEAEECILQAQVGFTYCAITASSPDNARRQHVTNKGRHANPSGYGLYGRPRKPANSGRKRKAA